MAASPVPAPSSSSTRTSDPLRRLAKGILSQRAIGLPLSRALRATGFEHPARRIAKLCRDMPAVITIRPDHARAFAFSTAGGHDQLAVAAYYEGWDSIERPLPRLFLALAARAGEVIDVGANTGFYALLAAAAGARVHAVEPFPLVRASLERNLALARMQDRVTIVAGAMSAAPGSATLYVPRADHGLIETSASLEATFRREHSQEIAVDVDTVDAYVARRGVRVGLMKIDVEGHEPAVLAGATATLRTQKPFVTIEVLDAAAGDALREIVRSLGYVGYQLAPAALERTGDLIGNPARTNQLLCPETREHELDAIAAAAGLTVRRD